MDWQLTQPWFSNIQDFNRPASFINSPDRKDAWYSGDMNDATFNLWFGWFWILLGFISGTALGIFFADEKWLGGYGGFKRRMYRLCHISFFGLGTVNLLFWGTMRLLSPTGPLTATASAAFIVGGVAMPICCLAVAHFPRMHMLFVVPVVALILAGIVTLILLRAVSPAPGLN